MFTDLEVTSPLQQAFPVPLKTDSNSFQVVLPPADLISQQKNKKKDI